jgi:sigma-E factor negative regulatory protein RseC
LESDRRYENVITFVHLIKTVHVDGTIEHLATVENVEGDAVDVVMTVDGACQSCNAQKICGMNEGKERRISIRTPFAAEFSPGDSVVVGIERRMSVPALAVAYIYPFVLMLAALLALLQVGVVELFAGLASLGVLAVYYFVVWLLRSRIGKQFVFKINKA